MRDSKEPARIDKKAFLEGVNLVIKMGKTGSLREELETNRDHFRAKMEIKDENVDNRSRRY